MDKLNEVFLHHGIESAGGFVENEYVGIGHKRRDDGEFSFYAEAHPLGFSRKGGVVQFKQIQHTIQLLFVVAMLQILHHFDERMPRKPCGKRDFARNIAYVSQYLVVFVERFFSENFRRTAVRL